MNKSKKQIVTREEIAAVEKSGFHITAGKVPCHKFINDHFAGLHLKTYLQEIDDLIVPLSEANLEKEFSYFDQYPPPMIIIQYCSNDHANDKTGLALSLTFIRQNDQIIADIDFLRLPLSARGKGIAKQFLKLSMEQYEYLGVNKIRLEAALENGGLFWAKAFFVATEQNEVKAILDRAEHALPKTQFGFVKRIYDNYYFSHPNGKAFPMSKWSQIPGMDKVLTGSYWHGELDLNNSDLLAKFKEYVA